jgi:hypothetical protein
MAGHNVYTMPLENLLAAKNALATRTNPNPDDQRVVVFLQFAVMQLSGVAHLCKINPFNNTQI